MSALEHIQTIVPDAKVDVALVLGSGLSALADVVQNQTIIPYADLDGFPGFGKAHGGVSGHGSDLVLGQMGGKNVAILTGREHYYEHGNAAAMRPALETLAQLGAHTLMLTNSAGSLDPDVEPGDLMLLSDHINYAGMNPLIGEPSDKRFVNLVDCYDPAMRDLAKSIAKDKNISIKEGVYLWYSGPSFETVAEIQMAVRLGANAVGMSTAPEVILGRYLGLKVWACSAITNMGAGLRNEEISHAQTKRMAVFGAEKLIELIPAVVEAI